MTNREIISLIRSTHRLLSGDATINDRTVFSEIKAVSPDLIKRELNKRKLTATSSIYTVIPCLEMEEVPLSSCCQYNDSDMIARTKEPLPRIGESNYSYAIGGVYAINGKKIIRSITPTRYINILKLPTAPKGPFYWIEGDYLYITDPNVCQVKLVAYFETEVPNSVLYPEDCECSKHVNNEDRCKNPLDREFKFPGYLINVLTDIVSKRLLSTYFRLPEDMQSDTADGQAPNQIGK